MMQSSNWTNSGLSSVDIPTRKDVAIIVVTYKRQDLLSELFDSFRALPLEPGHIYIVDNENSSTTKALTERLNATTIDADVHYLPQSENTGGAGGFSAGVKAAYEAGAEWLWLMDDDVKLFPDAVEKIEPWLQRGLEEDFRVMQVRRMNFDNTPFYWQYNFLLGLGIPNPFAPSDFRADETYKVMNTACFEGGLFHRSVISEIGYPDYRFFIYNDDSIYGYLASKITTPILINETVMQRTRSLEHVKIGSIRKLNSTSDMVRYYIMRNRGYIAQYLRLKGDYNAFLFTLGTALTYCKEVIRLFITKSFISGHKRLIKGMRDAKTIRKQKDWKPMPMPGK